MKLAATPSLWKQQHKQSYCRHCSYLNYHHLQHNHHYHYRNQHSFNLAGFTLIELLITTSLTVLLMLTVTTMFMTFLVGNSKTNVRKSVKEEGLHAMNQMEFSIKNAHYVNDSTCIANDTNSSIEIVGLDGGTTTYSAQNNKIASRSGTVFYLTSSAVTLVENSLNFNCSGIAGNRQIIVSFDLEKNAPTLNENSLINEHFESIVNVRN